METLINSRQKTQSRLRSLRNLHSRALSSRFSCKCAEPHRNSYQSYQRSDREKKQQKKGKKCKRTLSISSESSLTSSLTSDTDSDHDSGQAQSAPSLAYLKEATSKCVKRSKDGGHRKHTLESDKTCRTTERANSI